MSEFVEFKEVVERIKDIICSEYDGYVYDKYVAEQLKMADSTFRSCIYKNKIPYFEVSRFCFKRGLIINDLIFKIDS